MAHVNFEPYPTVGPEPRPPEDYQNIRAVPGAFGGQVAAGGEKLGAGITDAGKLYGEIATDDQANHVLSGLDDMNAKFRSLQGKEAMDQYPAVRQQMDQLLSTARANLSTTDQALDFDRQTSYLYSRAQREAGDHYDQEMKTWGVATNKASGDLALNGITRAAQGNDGNALASHTNDLINARTKNAQLLHGANLTPDMQQDIIRQSRSDATKASVELLIQSDPARAQQYLEAGKGNLLGPEYDALSGRLKQPLVDAQAQQLVFGAPPSGGQATVAPMQVAQAAQANGVDPALANATAAIESGHGANVGARGDVYQMGPEERTSVGGGAAPATSPTEQVDQGVKFLAEKQKELSLTLGRTPTNAEVYLAHQQGTNGATALLTHPDEPAGKAVGSDAAIRDNGGDPNAPASQFVQMWQQRYQHAEQQYQGGSAGSPYPYPSDRLQKIMASDATPQAKEAAARLVELQWSDHSHAWEAQQRQLKDSSDARENEILTSIGKGQPIVNATQALADPALTPDARIRMSNFIATRTGNDVEEAGRAYGPGFWNAYKGVTAPAGDPSRITDQAKLIDRAGPGGDLTLAGVQELTKTMQSMRRPEQAGDTKLQAGALAYAKHQLSFEADYGTFKVRDPKGEDAFNIGFTPAFMNYWNKGIADGKTPAELVDKTQIDKLITPYKRPPSELMRDQLQSGTEATEGATQQAQGPPSAAAAYLRANPQLRGAFDQKYGAGAADGILGPPAPAAPAAPAPPIAGPNG